MVENKSWVQALNIPDESYKDWLLNVPSGCSVTQWALDNNKINIDAYLGWARNHYSIASLSDEYFQQPPNIEFWNRVKDIASWSENCFPIFEWDGVIFIACLEPMHDTQWSFPTHFFLASHKALQAFWQQLNTVEASPSEDPIKQEAIEPSSTPEGLNLNLSTLTDNKAPLASEDEKLPPPFPTEIPEGLNLNPDSAPIEMPEGLNLETPPAFNQKNIQSKSMPPDPAPAEVMSPAEPKTASLKSTPPATVDPEVLASLKHTANCDDTEINDIFTELHQHFTQVMVLIFDGENLKPWVDDGQWTPASEEAYEAIDVSSPCMFKIVKKSQQPYHGAVTSNEINNRFFENWSLTPPPEHVTICPIKYDSHVAGMLFCVGPRKANTLHVLSFAEQKTEALKPLLEKLQTTQAA